jgi:hypothetical protein
MIEGMHTDPIGFYDIGPITIWLRRQHGKTANMDDLKALLIKALMELKWREHWSIEWPPDPPKPTLGERVRTALPW